MEVIEVTDATDPRLADFRNLQDADVRPDRRGIVIAEGTNVVTRLATSAYPIRAVFGVPSKVEVLCSVLADRDVPIYVCDKWLLSEVVGFRVTRGVLAAASRPRPWEPSALLASARRVVVLEALNDFENLGALFRNAAAFGVDAVLLDPTCADPLYRRSVRVSMGHALRVPFAVLPGAWPGSLALVKSAGLRLLAMTPDPAAEDLRAVPPPQRWAVLLGAEGPGLSSAAMGHADQQVRIPMAHGVDSLNVATAGAIAFAHLA
ncbi:MAG TPA: RNA methyltransferase [Jatrophihabitantaceae bacterium]|nr:RNA methyltransferase [Jatrophihabitantaceae bacterium]